MCCTSDSADHAMLYHLLYLHPCMCCLFVYLFVCLSLFLSITCCLPCLFTSPFRLFQIVSIVNRQWADVKSNCAHCIRRGLGRRLRSSLLLNSSPSTSRDVSLSHLVETHQSLAISMCSGRNESMPVWCSL